ncbi:tRNA (guanosine(18)-2'-O)-methyltransferase [Neolewinella maritima]|uniref:tRNA (Guanosine(18)-2'-O)-methyltransferase n=1 Tax=Neolewinella maritima TaxID=1383882 RepID=A0ABN8F581_9BACT|nr:tRNA (guanosine(18)-2'-O)-methyltransferase [Neolewinella maritima]
MPYEVITDPLQYIETARRQGKLILGLEITSQSTSLFTYRLPHDREILLLAGTESSGLSAPLLAACDATVHLPMHGQNTSMNVAAALGAAVYLLLMQLQ